MPRVPPILNFVVSVVLLAAIVGFAERAVRSSTAIPDLIFFGVPVVSLAIACFSSRRVRAAQNMNANIRRAGDISLGVALAVTLLGAVLLRDHYRGDYDPMRGRVAPDGAAVTSISWRQEGGRYIERLNNRFDIELTETQYSDKVRVHQRALFIVPIVFSLLAVLVSISDFLLERKFAGHGS